MNTIETQCTCCGAWISIVYWPPDMMPLCRRCAVRAQMEVVTTDGTGEESFRRAKEAAVEKVR